MTDHIYEFSCFLPRIPTKITNITEVCDYGKLYHYTNCLGCKFCVKVSKESTNED